MSAPAKNQNASKPDADKATATLSIRTQPRNIAAWKRVVKQPGESFTGWVTRVLNREAGL